ncbi:MAG: FAD:protein FMN transferase [Gammaproteobacteria bacterium]|jgi:thiamine biosynthesis lipoprotein
MLVAAAMVVCGSAAQAAWFGERIDLMGTSVSVELWHEDAVVGEQLVTQVIDEYHRIDELMSTYRDSSEISHVNANAAAGAVRISEELFGLIRRSLEVSRRSAGAFDISYESVGYLYDFHERQRPGGEQIAAALPAIDYRAIELDAQHSSIAFTHAGTRINLGGIAKGYAVERAAQWLKSKGVEHAVLNAGGDTRVLGDRRGEPWIVGIRHPRARDDVITRLPLVNEAISTSGDYERFFEEGGQRYHHIINPDTGRPTDELMSVTVIGPDAVLTDALSTTVFVLGMERGLELIETWSGYEAIVVDRGGILRYSSGLAEPQ